MYNCVSKPNKTYNILNKTLDIDEDKLFDLKMKALMKIGSHKAISACVIKGDEVVFSKSYGTTNFLKTKVANNKSIYLISSTTKAIVGTAMMQLYEQGKYDLDEDVNSYLPFSLRNPHYPKVNITFRMLLSHRASLFDHFLWTRDGRNEMFKDFFTTGLITNTTAWLEEKLIPENDKYEPEYWLDVEPGTDASYSNTGFLLVGCLLESISGKPIEDYCQENIFEPLEMVDTSFYLEELDLERVIMPFFKIGGIFIPIKNYNTSGFSFTCGVRTTIEDLSHFLIAHMNNGTWKNVQILEESTVQIMHSIEAYDHDGVNIYDYRYGLGWFESDKFGYTMEGHGGDNFGYLASMMMNKTTNTGFIFLSAGSPPTLGIFPNPISIIKSYFLVHCLLKNFKAF
jgi:CubicO group peptidase (beta-lactamase class C family)